MRRIYRDYILNKILKADVRWFFKLSLRYLLVQASFRIRRALCGPILCHFFVTYQCNYRCKMCDLPSRDKKIGMQGLKHLSTPCMKKLIKDCADLGVIGMSFTGGEPLMREDIFNLLSYAKELGIITHLNTNGFFINEEVAERLISIKVDSVSISLDGSREVTHDTIRGAQGSFKMALEAVEKINHARNLLKAPIRLKVSSVVNNSNVDELPDMLKLFNDLDADSIEFIPEQPFFEGYKDNRFDASFFNKLDKSINYIIKAKRSGARVENSFRHLRLFEKSFKAERSPITCFAGYHSFGLDCFGNIFNCASHVNMGKAVGNIKDTALKEFWYSSHYNALRNNIRRCGGCYLNCQAELDFLFS